MSSHGPVSPLAWDVHQGTTVPLRSASVGIRPVEPSWITDVGINIDVVS